MLQMMYLWCLDGMGDQFHCFVSALISTCSFWEATTAYGSFTADHRLLVIKPTVNVLWSLFQNCAILLFYFMITSPLAVGLPTASSVANRCTLTARRWSLRTNCKPVSFIFVEFAPFDLWAMLETLISSSYPTNIGLCTNESVWLDLAYNIFVVRCERQAK